MNPTDWFPLLDAFQIEVPSWGFADTGTRFGKFPQPAAAATIEEKIEDAARVHQLTGACPTMAVHVLWDFKAGADPRAVAQLAQKHGIAIGSINPNLFQDAHYKYGSAASPNADARKWRTGTLQIASKSAKRPVPICCRSGLPTASIIPARTI